jgi:hypothetical protein
MCGAHPVAVRDRGQALYMHPRQSRDRGRLRLAQLREFRSHGGHRTVVLTQLIAAGDLRYLSSVALGGENRRECLGAGTRIRSRRRHRGLAPLFDAGETLTGELRQRSFAAYVCQMAQRGDGQIVVAVWELRAPRSREGELPGWAAAMPATAKSRLAAFDFALRYQVVKMTSNGRRAQAEGVAQFRRAGSAALEKQPPHLVARAVLLSTVLDRNNGRVDSRNRARGSLDVFHNTIVTYFDWTG